MYDFASSSRIAAKGTGKGRRPARKQDSKIFDKDAGSSTDTDAEMTIGHLDKLGVGIHTGQSQTLSDQLNEYPANVAVTKAIEEAKDLLLNLVKVELRTWM